jgi:sirohydrochlorin ferrochelatase
VTAGIIVFAHGSRIEAANEAVRAIAADLARAGKYQHVQAAFLELGRPDLASAVEVFWNQGIQKVIVIPYFLTLGIHLERDLPALLADISRNHNGLQLTATPPLDGHPALLQILLDRARAI